MPRLEFSDPDDFEKWGNLVKTWATGQDRLGLGAPLQPPKTPQELNDQMARAGISARVPDQIKFVQFIVPDDTHLVIMLPPGKDIEDAERLLQGRPYPLPAFYKKAFGKEVDPGLDWKTFNAERLGEYTINNCQ